MRKRLVDLVLISVLALAACLARAWAAKPPLGWTTEASVTRVIDGDTVKVKIERTFNVRLRGVDAPEISTEEGRKALRFVQGLVDSHDGQVTVTIPAENPERLMDVTSFERIVGDVYIGDDNLVELLKKHGHVKKP